MKTEPELLNERLERLAMVLDEIMPNCASLVRDALELLKEQEAVKPEPIMGTSISDCGKCRHAVAPGMNYCPVCGCRIDWN